MLVSQGIAVQSIGFKKYLPVGDPVIVAEYLNRWGVDEVVYLDIGATVNNNEPNYDLIESVAKRCFVPLAVGGGIKNVDCIRRLIKSGADKVIINSELFNNIKLLENAANAFGSQCIIAAIDLLLRNNKYEIRSHSSSDYQSDEVDEWAKKVVEYGAGELLINCIHRDGMKNGYDINLLDNLSACIKVPVIACGGAGNPQHILELFKSTEVSAAAVGNYFNYVEHAPVILKSFLKKNNIDIRIDTEYDYLEHECDINGNIYKKNDNELYELIFNYYEPEVI